MKKIINHYDIVYNHYQENILMRYCSIKVGSGFINEYLYSGKIFKSI